MLCDFIKLVCICLKNKLRIAFYQGRFIFFYKIGIVI